MHFLRKRRLHPCKNFSATLSLRNSSISQNPLSSRSSRVGRCHAALAAEVGRCPIPFTKVMQLIQVDLKTQFVQKGCACPYITQGVLTMQCPEEDAVTASHFMHAAQWKDPPSSVLNNAGVLCWQHLHNASLQRRDSASYMWIKLAVHYSKKS